MLTKLSLKNVKSFDDESTLDLAPVTLIYGPNSSGKSTLWKFLITLRDSLRRGYGSSFLNFSRSDDFANARTISFDPKESSNFGLSFFGGRKIYYDMNCSRYNSILSCHLFVAITRQKAVFQRVCFTNCR